jgi:glutamyl-tRNA synthetase
LNQFNKTRIAPTPSGFLHLGNILSFAITAALARKTGAKILLRIDDLDRARVNHQYIQDIFDTLHFLEIPWDEGPRDVVEFEQNYSQQRRMALYHTALKQLAAKGAVYACTCSRQQIFNSGSDSVSLCNCIEKQTPLDAENVNWRLFTKNDAKFIVKNYNNQTTEVQLPAEIQNFVVKKKDGFPAYQLTSVIDDMFYGIDLIVRGNDLWPSTLGQHALAIAVNKGKFGEITFYHHPLLMAYSGQKLSKSAGATSVRFLRESGKVPADIYSLIAGMAGLSHPVADWEQLAAALLTGF